MITINDELFKPLIGDLVLARMYSALINENKLRAQVSEFRANKALQVKQEKLQAKLASLETKKAKLAEMGQTHSVRLNSEKAKVQSQLDRNTAVQASVAASKAEKQATLRANFSAKIQAKYNADLIKARLEKTTQAKLAHSAPKKTYLSIFKQRTQNAMAAVMNHTRKFIGQQRASIMIPKFTTRGAVHSTASIFGLVVGAYDLIRMFDPSVDIWKKKKPDNSPVVDIPYPPEPPEPRYFFPLCDDVVESGVANPTNPVLCRQNKPRAGESLSYNGLTYQTECPPMFRKYKFGVFDRCVLAGTRSKGYDDTQDLVNLELTGIYQDININPRDRPSSWKSAIVESNPGVNTGNEFPYRLNNDDPVESNWPQLYRSMPEDFFVRLGLRKFYNDLQADIRAYEPVMRAMGPGPTPPAWSSNAANSTTIVPDTFEGNKYAGELSDPDWPYQQWASQDVWGKPGGARSSIDRHLAEFGVPFTDVGVSVRGGEDLTDAQIAAILFPDVTGDEIDSAVDAQNEEDIKKTGDIPQLGGNPGYPMNPIQPSNPPNTGVDPPPPRTIISEPPPGGLTGTGSFTPINPGGSTGTATPTKHTPTPAPAPQKTWQSCIQEADLFGVDPFGPQMNCDQYPH
jgi:hypothetical protein